MYKNLEHLSEDEMKKFIEDYYTLDIKKLAQKYKLDIPVSRIYLLLPSKEIKDDFCPYCNIPLFEPKLPKTEYNQLMKYHPEQIETRIKRRRYCPNCHHEPYNRSCNCDNCHKKHMLEQMEEMKKQKEREEIRIKKEKEKEQERLEIIKLVYDYDRTSPKIFDELDFKNKVLLGALCTDLLEENTKELISYKTASESKLAPSSDYVFKMYETLIDDKIIKVSPLSSIEAFVFNKNDYPASFYPFSVKYYLNMDYVYKNKDVISAILNPNYYNVEKDAEVAISLWREIAILECIEYLLYKLRAVSFEFSPGEKTVELFKDLLKDFSVSQIYGIIHKSVANASNYYLEGNINKNRAANSVISGCQRFAERARNMGWNLYSYSRLKDLSQSTISFFLAYKVLKIGDRGFYLPPTIESLLSFNKDKINNPDVDSDKNTSHLNNSKLEVK